MTRNSKVLWPLSIALLVAAALSMALLATAAISIALLATAAIGVAAVASIGVRSSKAGKSIKTKMILALVRVQNRAAASASPEGAAKMIADSRRDGPAPPPRWVAKDLDVQQREIEGGTACVVTPHEAASLTRMLYLHGGAFMLNLLPAHWPILAGLAKRTGMEMTIPLYPLAPENDHRPAFAMIDAVYAEMVDAVGATNIVLAGDSAGGGLALSLCQAWRDRGIALPSRLALLSPWADATVSDPAQTEIAKRDFILSIDSLREAGFAWAGRRKTNDPVVSPLFGSLAGLPPMLVLTGTDDILNSDAHRLKTSARENGTPLELIEFEGMFHVWATAPIPEAELAIDLAAAFLTS